MATTIKSTALDFNAIKNNLKQFLEESGEFTDYNFDGSGLSSILDVLAYNTHYNALTANFALNESFLSTAQLRSSILSLAEGIGYVADSRTSSQALVNLSLNLSVPNTPQNQAYLSHMHLQSLLSAALVLLILSAVFVQIQVSVFKEMLVGLYRDSRELRTSSRRTRSKCSCILQIAQLGNSLSARLNHANSTKAL